MKNTQSAAKGSAKKESAAITGTDKAAKPDWRRLFWTKTLPNALNFLVMLLSLGLIFLISLSTYKGVDYLENRLYMGYQLVVCLFFLLEYFYRLAISRHKPRYFCLAMPFLLISIPYLNIIEHYHIAVKQEVLIYICFVPIVRGLVALVMVVSFLAKRIASTVFISYILVVIPTVYMSAMIFYVAEKGINPGLKNFWYALWWAGMNITTIGCDINPLTGTGMIISFILSLLGIIMLPLFTVYTGDFFNVFTNRNKPANGGQL